MAKVHLLSVELGSTENAAWRLGAYRSMLASQRADRFQVHALTDDPAAADVILFLEVPSEKTDMLRLRRHPLVRRFREKCFLSDSSDQAIPYLPGFYASIEKTWYSPRRTRSGPFPSSMENAAIEYDPVFNERRYLYSFVGSTLTWPVRAELAKLRHGRGYFEDRSADSLRIRMTGDDQERGAFAQHYVDVIRRSQFVLCPRGIGCGSIRLFETLQAGRVPVILSDAWVPPAGPAWAQISVRVAEEDWAAVPALLEAREGEAAGMGRSARRAWEEWFAPPVLFHRTVEQCLEMRRQRRLPEAVSSRLALLQVVLRPFHLRMLLRRGLQRG